MSHYQGSVPDTEPARAWLALAPCRAYADTMFDTSPASIEAAKSICGRCTVVDQCRQWALDNREAFGTWGGLSERERARILRRRGIRLAGPVEEEEPRPRTFQSLYDERTVALKDGHLAWTGAVPVHCAGAYHTPAQIAFRLDRGRPAIGKVRRTCEREGCVLPSHLADQQERNQRREEAAKSAATYSKSGRLLAPCGTRSAYSRHVKRGEPIDAACRQANTDADNRLRRTGTTKVFAS